MVQVYIGTYKMLWQQAQDLSKLKPEGTYGHKIPTLAEELLVINN